MRRARSSPAFAAALLGFLAGACEKKTTPTPVSEKVPATTASSAANDALHPAPPAPAKGVSTLTLEPFTPEGTKPSAVFAIDGALMVVDGQRVGRVAGEGVEWVGRIPKGGVAYG